MPSSSRWRALQYMEHDHIWAAETLASDDMRQRYTCKVCHCWASRVFGRPGHGEIKPYVRKGALVYAPDKAWLDTSISQGYARDRLRRTGCLPFWVGWGSL